MTSKDLIENLIQIHRDNPNGAIYMYILIASSIISYRLKNRFEWAKNLWNFLEMLYIILGLNLFIGKLKNHRNDKNN